MSQAPVITLVLGGARSGKSRHAQMLAEAEGGTLHFIATGQAFDAEMADRIARHQAERGAAWETIEAPTALRETIDAHAAPGKVLLIDCLTLWTSNLLLAEQDIEAATHALCGALDRVRARALGRVILVANEVGLGIVPDNALARRFRDAAGRVNQAVAATADHVVFVAAGLPLTLK